MNHSEIIGIVIGAVFSIAVWLFKSKLESLSDDINKIRDDRKDDIKDIREDIINIKISQAICKEIQSEYAKSLDYLHQAKRELKNDIISINDKISKTIRN